MPLGGANVSTLPVPLTALQPRVPARLAGVLAEHKAGVSGAGCHVPAQNDRLVVRGDGQRHCRDRQRSARRGQVVISAQR